MSGLKDQSAFETFDRMAGKIDQLEAEAEAGAELQAEVLGDVLASQPAAQEKTHGADDDLLALKRKMGLPPPEAAPAQEAAPVQARLEARVPAGGGTHEGARRGRRRPSRRWRKSTRPNRGRWAVERLRPYASPTHSVSFSATSSMLDLHRMPPVVPDQTLAGTEEWSISGASITRARRILHFFATTTR